MKTSFVDHLSTVPPAPKTKSQQIQYKNVQFTSRNMYKTIKVVTCSTSPCSHTVPVAVTELTGMGFRVKTDLLSLR